jgi:hypothetical protein
MDELQRVTGPHPIYGFSKWDHHQNKTLPFRYRALG